MFTEQSIAVLLSVLVSLVASVTVAAAEGDTLGANIPDGFMIVEGDIIVPKDYTHTLSLTNYRSIQSWPEGVVPYEFDDGVSAANQTKMLNAMAELERVSSVQFVPWTSETDFLNIQAGSVNSSYVGRQGGRQEVNIASWDWRWIIVHELMHALGFWHEQSRPDRDGYIVIEWDNIEPGQGHNFQEQFWGAGHYGPYDFHSIMHYGQCAFSNCTPCCSTITVLPPNQAMQTVIGQRTNFSRWDSLSVGFIYPREPNWQFLSVNAQPGLRFGTFFYPWLTLDEALLNTPTGGTLWIKDPGQFNAIGIYDKAMTIRAPQGATLGN